MALAALFSLTTSIGCTTTSTDRPTPPARSSPVLAQTSTAIGVGAIDVHADAAYVLDGFGVARLRGTERESIARLDVPIALEDLTSFAVAGDESVWIVTSGPELIRWDGDAWAEVALPDGASSVAVDARSIDDVWITVWSFGDLLGDDSICHGTGDDWDCAPATWRQRRRAPSIELSPSFVWTIDADGVVHRRAADGSSEAMVADDCIDRLRVLDDTHVFAVACSAAESIGRSPPHPALTFDGTAFVALHPTAQFVEARAIDDVWLVEADQGFVSTTSGGGCLPTWGCSDRTTHVDSAWRRYVVFHDDGTGFVEVGHADFLTRLAGGAGPAGIFPLGPGDALLVLEGFFDVTAP